MPIALSTVFAVGVAAAAVYGAKRMVQAERALAAERARRSRLEAHLQEVLDAIPADVAVLDAEGRIEAVNAAWRAAPTRARIGDDYLAAWSAGDVDGPSARDVAAVLRDLVAGRAARLDVQYGCAPMGEPRWFRLLAAPLAAGPAGAVVMHIDVTEQRRMESALSDTEHRLRQAQKMEAIGRLAGGVAHDFNNVLTAITGYADLLMLGDDSDRTKRDAGEIRKAADRAAGLTRQLLAFSRRQRLELVVLDPNGVVADMETMLRRLIGEDVRLVTRLAAEGTVKADRGQLEQVLMNLAVNARDAMPAGGTLTIETANVVLDDAWCDAHVDAAPGPHVRVTVSDTGQGMDEETLSHLFEPFFTTKPPGKGTGLGLSTVYGIVKQSGGHVTVASDPGRGARFAIYLPRADEAHDRRQDERRALPLAPGGAETVLVVEDEDAVRRLAAEVLRRRGYAVLEARSGDEALAVAGRHRAPIALLLTDTVLPGMSGEETARRLTAAYPRLRVLFTSGYPERGAEREGGSAPAPAGAAFLAKPFTAESLARAVRERLDAAPTLA